MNEPNKALQEEELISLQAIFGDDWHDIPAKKTAWGTEGEHGWWEVQLHATDDDRVRVKLRGRMTKTYPEQPPPLQILDPVKVTPQQVQTLTRLLHEQAKSKVGEQMIFDLCDFVQSWLAENHVPLPKPGEPEPTLMEEMALREEAKRAAEEAQHIAAHKKRQAAEAERNRVLNEKIQLDASRKEERMRKAILDQEHRLREERVSGLDDGEFEMRELVLDEPISIDGHQGKWAKWTVFGGRREALWTSYAAEPVHDKDQNFVRASNPTVTVQVVDFSKPYYNGSHGRKRIDTLTNELLRLKGVHSKHVARLYAVQRTKSPKGWERLIVVVERVADVGRLRTWLPKDGFEEETAKEYMAQILAGLADLHRAHAMQKQLDLDLVLLSAGAGDEVVLKLSGTGYARRIIEYHRSNPFLKLHEDGYPDSWLSPDEIDTPYSYSPKRDVWYAGLVLLQMLFGRNCLWTYPDLHTLLAHAPGGVSPSVADLLSGLLNPVHKRRLTAEDALTRLRAPEDEITHRPSLYRSGPGSISIPASSASSFHPDMFGKSPQSARGFGSFNAHFSGTPGGSVRYSRYRADFEEVEFLGKGGFGEVVKARNKLDGRPYAIKKVKLRPEDDVNRVLREVNSLSRVSHQYIVRYYSCWLEDVGGGDGSANDTGSEMVQSSINSSNVSSESEDIFAVNFDDVSRREQSRSASFPRIRFAADSDEDDDDDSEESEDDSDGSDDSNESEHTIADPSSRRGRSTSRAVTVPSKPSKPSASWTDASTEDGSVQRILYIQMEFVEKQTLREAITAGLSEEECWRLFVQILQALAHMSSLGIVHRGALTTIFELTTDLKPSNILLDANGNVKIADFGLSTTDLAVEAGVGLTASTSADDIDRTSNIGTSLYIAPEVLVSRSYNEKADMYSLGIILFEMCFAFTTGMERAHTLNALRSSSIVFPPGWPITKMPKQREIITLLLTHDPQMRPQATQLLSGPLVPTINREEQFYDHVITEITNPRSEKYLALMEALFATDDKSKFGTDNRQDDYTFDNDHDDTHELWQVVVKGRIKKLLRRHGAIEAVLPLLIPETTLLKPLNERAVVRLLDSSGKFVHLPSSNIVGMARSASRQSISRIKRYVAGNRYSELPAGGQPATHCEICFEIISTIRAHAAETELLQLMDRVIEECNGPRLSTQIEYELHVNHESILQGLLSTCPGPLRSKVLRAFKGPAAGVAFGASRPSLGSIPGLPKTVASDLEAASPVGVSKSWGDKLTLKGDFETVRQNLEETYPELKRKLAPALEEIAAIVSLARACGVKMKILFRPTLSRHSEYFRGGFMFECVRKGKPLDVIAYGGRHDSLLDHFKDPGTVFRKVHGVVVSISADHVTRMVRNKEIVVGRRLMNKTKVEERSFGIWAPARCDVYISYMPGVTIRERLVVAAQLWRAGIRADLQYDDDRTQQDVLDECLDQSVLFVVIIRPHKDEAKVIRVLTGKNSEESVPEDKLVMWLKTAIENQRRIDRAYAEGATPVVKGQNKDVPEQQHSTRASSADINLVLPPEPLSSRGVKSKAVRKYRHGTKSLYYEKGEEDLQAELIAADEFAASVKSTLPVIGVDMSLELLSQLTLDTNWITDDEAWRALTHPVLPNSERSYAEQVRRAVVDHTKSPGGNAWLFSVRDGRGFLLQLSK